MVKPKSKNEFEFIKRIPVSNIVKHTGKYSIRNNPLSHNTNQNPKMRVKDKKSGKHNIMTLVRSHNKDVSIYSYQGIRQFDGVYNNVILSTIEFCKDISLHNFYPLYYNILMLKLCMRIIKSMLNRRFTILRSAYYFTLAPIARLHKQNPIRRINPLHTAVKLPIKDKNQAGINFMHDDADMIFDYKINPHINPRDTKQKAIQTLRKTVLQSKIRPYSAG